MVVDKLNNTRFSEIMVCDKLFIKCLYAAVYGSIWGWSVTLLLI